MAEPAGEDTTARDCRPLRRRDACPVCGLGVEQTVVDSSNYLACPSCGLVFSRVLTLPVPSEQWDSAYYSDDRVMEYYEGRRSAFEHMVTIMDGLVPRRGSWLDVGCGSGRLLQAAHQHGWAPHGIEPSQISVEEARRRVPTAHVAEGRVEERLDDFSGIAVVSFVDVLKYVDEPRLILTKLRDVLADGGWVFVREADARRDRRHRARMAYRERPETEFHLQKWDPSALEKTLALCGYANVRSFPSPIFTETTGGEREEGIGLRWHVERGLRRLGWPVARTAHRFSAGRIYLTPNFVTIGQKPPD